MIQLEVFLVEKKETITKRVEDYVKSLCQEIYFKLLVNHASGVLYSEINAFFTI